MGTEKSKGVGLFSLSGHVSKPGQYEAPLGITLRQLLDLAGGVRAGHELKFWTPGGSSTPILTAEHLDVPLDFESVGAAGSMLGTRALQIFDETTCVGPRRAALDRVLQARVVRQVHALPGRHLLARAGARAARARRRAARRISTCCSTSATTSSVGRSAPSLTAPRRPIQSSIQYFRDEYLAHLTDRGLPLRPRGGHAVRDRGSDGMTVDQQSRTEQSRSSRR